MEGRGRPSFEGGGDGERPIEMVSGIEYYNCNGNRIIYMTTTPTPWLDPQTVPPAAVRSSQAAVAAKPWGFNDPKMKRRKRVARYKVYSVEGKVKASIRNGLRWIKNKCSEIIHGY